MVCPVCGVIRAGFLSRIETENPSVPLPSRELLIVAIHGILTGGTNPTWPDRFQAWLSKFRPRAKVLTTEYFELPLPRLAAARNPGRVTRLLEKVNLWLQLFEDKNACPYDVALVGHSNGGVLAFQLARELIADGHRIEHLVLMSPALRTTMATRQVAQWIGEGSLKNATLVVAENDKLLSFISRLKRKIVTWPWGSLGADGWAWGALSAEYLRRARGKMDEIRLAEDSHSSFLAPGRDKDTFQRIVAPALGIQIGQSQVNTAQANN